jgi:hypothetical protein
MTELFREFVGRHTSNEEHYKKGNHA